LRGAVQDSRVKWIDTLCRIKGQKSLIAFRNLGHTDSVETMVCAGGTGKSETKKEGRGRWKPQADSDQGPNIKKARRKEQRGIREGSVRNRGEQKLKKGTSC